MPDYELYQYPKSRIATFDVGKIGAKKHHIAGFLEIDISSAREKISKYLKTGAKISFTSWMLKVIAVTIADNKNVHAINSKKRTQIVFNDVDISIPIEKIVDGNRVPLATVIRNVNKKTIEEIYNEIHEAKSQSVSSEKDFVLEKRKSNNLNMIFFNLPQWLRMLIWKILLMNPFRRKKNMGTVIVTGIKMTGNTQGWILPKSIHNLCFGIGSVNKKPWIYNNKIEIREILHLTILFDHDVIDGSLAARFTNKLVKNMEQALCLDENNIFNSQTSST